MFAKHLVKEGAIFKSVNDKKKYKLIQLVNGLRALLVSDSNFAEPRSPTPSSSSSSAGTHSDYESSDDEAASVDDHGKGKKLSGAALSVNVGTLNDPFDVQGLAHLLEHTILMGNGEYPEENSYDAFLNRKSGYVNAHTDYESTVYEFQVPNKYLHDSLQRFAAIFVNPLFRAQSLANEIRPVDNEFKNSLGDDDCRFETLFSSMARKDHSMSKFGFGNHRSLIDLPKEKGIDLNQEIIRFWQKHYHAANMNLVVQGEYDLETMEKWVIEFFTRVPKLVDAHKPRPGRFNGSAEFPYQEDKFYKVYVVEPVQSGDYLHISWWLPPKFNCYKTKPLSHLGSLLGHEGKGSLFSVLKKKGYVLELIAGNNEGNFESNEFQAIFSIQAKLTDSGMKNIDEVVGYIFSYIDLIKAHGPQRRHLEEDLAVRLYSFRFANEKSGTKNCVKIAENMTIYETEHILIGPKLIFELDEDKIRDSFPYFQPDKANFMIFSKKLFQRSEKPVQYEEWYETKYKVEEVPKKWLNPQKPANFEQDLHFPLPNEFIAENFDILPCDSLDEPHPKLIHETSHWRLWYKKDNKYEVPKACVNMVFRSPTGRSNPQIAAALDLFIRALIIQIGEDAYPAELAGVHYAMSLHESGLLLLFVGFNDKIHKLIEVVIHHIVNFNVDETTFIHLRRDLASEYFNAFNDPSELATSLRLSIVKPTHWSALQRRCFLSSITREMVGSSARLLLANAYLECLIQGNLTSKQSISIVDMVSKKLKFNPIMNYSIVQDRANQLPPGPHICRVLSFNREEKSSVITNYYQFQPLDTRSSCLLELLCSSMNEQLFDTLRSQEGLGYEVYNNYHDTYGVGGFSISVISDADKFNCSHIDHRIEAFLKKFSGTVLKMQEEEFDELVKGLIKVKSAPFLTLNEESKFYWGEILDQEYCFDKRQKEIATLHELTLPEFMIWAFLHLSDFPHRKKLSIQVVANGKEAINESHVIDCNPFVPKCPQLDIPAFLGTADCRRSIKAGSLKKIDVDFKKNHECHHLTGRPRSDQAEEEDTVYILKYLGPTGHPDDAQLIVDIDEFKKHLYVYPQIHKHCPPSS